MFLSLACAGICFTQTFGNFVSLFFLSARHPYSLVNNVLRSLMSGYLSFDLFLQNDQSGSVRLGQRWKVETHTHTHEHKHNDYHALPPPSQFQRFINDWLSVHGRPTDSTIKIKEQYVRCFPLFPPAMISSGNSQRATKSCVGVRTS